MHSHVKNRIAREYMDIAEIYDVTRFGEPYQLLWHELEVELIKKFLKKHYSVLEVGVGTGRFAESLAMHVRSFTGIDISKPMIYISRKKVYYLNNINLINADAENLPFKPNTFDFVFSMHVMWHLPYTIQEKIFSELVRVVKPGGKILFDMGNLHTIRLIHTIRRREIDFDKVGYHIGYDDACKLADKYNVRLIDCYGFRQFLPASHLIPKNIKNNYVLRRFIKWINSKFSRNRIFRLLALSIYYIFEKDF